MQSLIQMFYYERFLVLFRITLSLLVAVEYKPLLTYSQGS